MKFEFEDIDGEHSRAKVFGGWIVRSVEAVFHLRETETESEFVSGWDWRVAIAFVPDPGHEWNLKDNEEEVPELLAGTAQALDKLTLHTESK